MTFQLLCTWIPLIGPYKAIQSRFVWNVFECTDEFAIRLHEAQFDILSRLFEIVIDKHTIGRRRCQRRDVAQRAIAVSVPRFEQMGPIRGIGHLLENRDVVEDPKAAAMRRDGDVTVLNLHVVNWNMRQVVLEA